MALTASQRAVANRIISVGKRKGATPKELLAAMMTAATESNFSNPSGGDRDSAGWRQERAQFYRNPTNVKAAASRFFDETRAVRGKYGRAGDLAQAVQRSAFPGRYEQNRGIAREALREAGVSGGGDGFGGSVQLQDVVLGRKSIFDKAGYAQAQKEFALNQLLTARHGPQGSVMQRVGLLADVAPERSSFTRSKLTSQIVGGDTLSYGDSFGGSGKRGRVNIAGGANRAGVGVQPIVKQFLSAAAGIAKTPITVTTGTNHNRMTVNGNVSDHWDGHASDIAVPVDSAKGDRIAAAALMEAGVPRSKAMAMARRGGLYTLNHNGRRIQVIWKTNEGGNHHNHVHVGIR